MLKRSVDFVRFCGLRTTNPCIYKFFSISKRLNSDIGRESQEPFRERPGYVASHRWLQQRPPNENLEKFLFRNVNREKDLKAEEKFLASSVNATVSGKPVTENFSYNQINSISDIPHADDRLLNNLQNSGVNYLTPVQKHAIGILSIDDIVQCDADGTPYSRVVGMYDLMAAAQTGSGKTLAYLIPLLNRLLRVYPYEAMQSMKQTNAPLQFPSGLILAPTRELVQQIFAETAKLCNRSYVRAVNLFGGESPDKQLAELRRGCHVVVATPGRLLDFLRREVLSLQHCRSLILDEADRMLDMGFEEQLRQIIESPKFGMPLSKASERQTSLYSATFPREVSLLARDFLRGSRCISLTLTDSEHDSGTLVPSWGQSGSAKQSNNPEQVLQRLSRIVPKEISQCIDLVESNSSKDMKSHLINLIQTLMSEHDSTEQDSDKSACRILIFCNTKREVDSWDRELYEARFRSAAIHGDKSQASRNKALDLFRKGVVNVLVASSVAARGLDIPHVRAVINMGLPKEIDDYVHRIGRTGRMGRSGQAITLISQSDLYNSPTAKSICYGLCRIIHASVGHLDQVPEPVLQTARWSDRNHRPEDEDDQPAPRRKLANTPFGPSRFNPKHRSSKFTDELDRRYG